MKRLSPILAVLLLAGCGSATKTVTAAPPAPSFPTAAQVRETHAREAGERREQREVSAQEAREAREQATQKRNEEEVQKVERQVHAEAAQEATQGSTVPNETSVRLDVAEEEMENAHLSYRVVGGGLFGVVVKSDWTVCETKPSPGAHVSSGATIRLIVARSC
jgi:hypothetical protein